MFWTCSTASVATGWLWLLHDEATLERRVPIWERDQVSPSSRLQMWTSGEGWVVGCQDNKRRLWYVIDLTFIPTRLPLGCYNRCSPALWEIGHHLKCMMFFLLCEVKIKKPMERIVLLRYLRVNWIATLIEYNRHLAPVFSFCVNRKMSILGIVIRFHTLRNCFLNPRWSTHSPDCRHTIDIT